MRIIESCFIKATTTNKVLFLLVYNELNLPGLLKAVQTISFLFATVVFQHWQQILGWRAVLNPNH